MNRDRRAVITGLGIVTPLGLGAEALWTGLVEKRSAVRRIGAFDPSGFQCQVGGEIDGLKMSDFVPKSYRKSTKVMARDIEIAVACAYLAAQDARLKTKCLIERGEVEGPPNIDPARLGANIGSGLICADLVELAGALASSVDEAGEFSLAQWGLEGMSNLTPLWLLKFLPNMLACHVTIVHDAQAPSNTITCGEASSHLAIGEAVRTIARGSADICICGGAESKLNPMGLLRQELLGRLCTSCNDNPAGACRPFDAKRDGTVISEGGGLIIVEELEHAKARGARIYGEVSGFGASADTTSWRSPDPEGRGIATSIRKALYDASLTADQVDLIAAQGLGTREHDLAEAAGIRAALGRRGATVPVMGTRGTIGNNGAGSGAIDLAASVLALAHNTIPPSLNTTRVDPACGLNVIHGDPVDARIDAVISTSFAPSGGQAACLVIRRYGD
ncbi:MAG: beta-ketoacyl-[acyl-carrier-protein] synthase family protein [Phycisphaerales bacterium]|nr:MAG: beta-ketoacyl-[acyl-carrier-protein] synthase family protein [Phycisphaerales bacterium]